MNLIDVAAVRAQMESLYEHHLEMGNFSADSAVADCLELLDNAPTIDAVPVVRCKDCKFFDTTEMCNCGFTNLYSREPDDFCSYGERRDATCDECDLTRWTE